MCPGIVTSQVHSWLGWAAPVVRSMPNTPVGLQQGATAMVCSPQVDAAMLDRVHRMWLAVSPVVEAVDKEDLLDVAAAVSGSVAHVPVLHRPPEILTPRAAPLPPTSTACCTR